MCKALQIFFNLKYNIFSYWICLQLVAFWLPKAIWVDEITFFRLLSNQLLPFVRLLWNFSPNYRNLGRMLCKREREKRDLHWRCQNLILHRWGPSISTQKGCMSRKTTGESETKHDMKIGKAASGRGWQTDRIAFKGLRIILLNESKPNLSWMFLHVNM